MARITLRQLLDHAAERGYGVPAFNINNMEQALAIMEAARATDSPVILQVSRGARTYANDIMLAKIMDALEAIYPEIPICIHQDHGNSVSTCLSAIQHGFTSVMMDGSLGEDAKTPRNYAENVAVTREVARLAHMVGASVEGELGCLGSLETGRGEAEDGHGFEGALDKSMLLTDPCEAKRFVAETNVDALAVAIGTSHGAYKFTQKPTNAVLAMDLIEKIHAKLPNTHIVMHGSSSVPQEWQDAFKAYGGAMNETYGVPVEEIVRGIRFGVRKINIDTDLRLAAAAEFRRVAETQRSEFDPRKFLKPAMLAMTALCLQRFEAFGTAGNASKIKVIAMSDMAKRYAAGEFGIPTPPTDVAKAA
ncbi:fructose-bisphosphate aldolase class II [Hyphomicrobium methylovorum]|uniref:class II fructose-bisphosphate aldolase n=1 Tax=Hyphomicrobium methylovorum TaxID=84 RepID=UPI0015E6AA2C|nr:class II fructose-bisphosphate aldolase [Hyphomicrobium methylovorum]MBA2127436.1 fructose-bisphosphate aldolase class II [Hyphomicrobium methylovorum]